MTDQQILRALSYGEGAEDIAVRSGIPVDAVRSAVTRLREQGRLREVWPKP